MKRLSLSLLAFAGVSFMSAAQPRYLVNELEPVDELCYEEFEFRGASSEPLEMSGGLKWYGGFELTSCLNANTPGHVTFDLGGKYETLMFVFAYMNTNRGAGGTGIDTEPCIFTVHVDGEKVVDEVVYPYGVPKRVTLERQWCPRAEIRARNRQFLPWGRRGYPLEGRRDSGRDRKHPERSSPDHRARERAACIFPEFHDDQRLCA